MASPDELLDLQETLYSSRNPTRRWLHTTRRDWILSKLSRENGIGRALEVGPGSGVYLPVLCSLSSSVIASDIEDAFLSKAKRLSAEFEQLSAVNDDISNTTLEKGRFDLILCTEVIEHIAESQPALLALASLLSEEGVLILSTPQRFSTLEIFARIAFLPGIVQLVRLVYREPVLETGHINLLSEAQLRTQLDNAGLEVVEQYKCGMYLPLIAEFGGNLGLKLLQRLETLVRDGPLDGLLWTQCYVLKKGGVDNPVR